MTSTDPRLLFLGPRGEGLGVPLARLGDQHLTVVGVPFPNARAPRRDGRPRRGLVGAHRVSQGHQDAPQTLEEQSQLLGIRQRDRADLLRLLTIWLLSYDEATVLGIGDEDDGLIRAADADLVSLLQLRHLDPFLRRTRAGQSSYRAPGVVLRACSQCGLVRARGASESRRRGWCDTRER